MKLNLYEIKLYCDCGGEWEQYQKDTALAWEQYQKDTAPAWEQYQKVRALAEEQYQKVRALAWAKLYLGGQFLRATY